MTESTSNIRNIPFEPVGLFKSAHWQTIYPSTLWTPPEPPSGKTLKIRVSDEVHLLCVYHQAPASKGCILLMHGLEGCVRSPYLLSATTKALDMGYSVLRMNMRSCGGSAYLSETFYHAGLTEDPLVLLQYMQETLDYKDIYAAGFSLGANQILKLAGEFSSVLPKALKGVIAVSPPLDLAECTRELLKYKNLVYERYYYLRMRKTFRFRKRFFPNKTRLELLSKMKNLRDFDEYVTAPEFGFQNALDYHVSQSCGPFLKDISCPTLIIHAKDDPVIPFSIFKDIHQKISSSTQLLITNQGGHVGFRNKKGLEKDVFWAENRMMDFIQSLSPVHNQTKRQPSEI